MAWARGGHPRTAFADARSRKNIKYFNQLMSRHARFGELDKVQQAFDEIKSTGLIPNEFTYCILLNANIRGGALERCENVLSMMQADGVMMNEVTYTTLIKGHVNSLNMAGAWDHYGQMVRDGICPNIRTINTMLRGCLYVGDIGATDRLMKYVTKKGLEPDQSTKDTVVRAVCQSFDLQRLRNVFAAYIAGGVETLSPAAQLDLSIAYALCCKFKKASKVLQLVQVGTAADSVGSRGKNSLEYANALGISVECVQAFLDNSDRKDLASRFSQDAVLRFPPLHGALSDDVAMITWHVADAIDASLKARPLFDRKRPVKLEVGAGLGDWIVARAGEQVDQNWVAIELRCDRACLIHAKGAMKGLTNLAVLGGNAHGIMCNALPSHGVAEVYVNFPQPPQREGSEDHLVNKVFLNEAWRVMQPGGILIITTDDKRYCDIIVRCLGHCDTLRRRWEPCFPPPHYRSYSGDLVGHASVFDKIWSARGFVHRYQCRYKAKTESGKKRTLEESAPQKTNKKKMKKMRKIAFRDAAAPEKNEDLLSNRNVDGEALTCARSRQAKGGAARRRKKDSRFQQTTKRQRP